jgi:hypothetical protein
MFFPPGSSVSVLPSRQAPKLYFPGGTFSQRFEMSSLYPAFRPWAVLLRYAMRARAGIGLGPRYEIAAGSWEFGEFISSCLPSATNVVVLVGTPSPSQKLIVQVWDERGVIGFAKYGEKPAAIGRLEHERIVLDVLPKAVRPQVLKHGTFLDGHALVLEAVHGRFAPASPIVPVRERKFLERLERGKPLELAAHPWSQRLRADHGDQADSLLEHLSCRTWPFAYQHGDFAPWNILRTVDGDVAVDWEFGSAEGMPLIDAAHYALQVAGLVERKSPSQARHQAAHGLGRAYGVRAAEADALVRLSAFENYQNALAAGGTTNSPRQLWRRLVWE